MEIKWRETSCGFALLMAFVFIFESIKLFAIKWQMWELANCSERRLFLLRNLALLNSTLLTSLVVYSSAKVYCEVYGTYLLLWLAAWHLLFAVKWVMAFIFLGPAEACLLVISCSFSVLTCSFVVCLLSSLSWVTDNEVWFCIDTSWTYCTLHC